MDCTHAKANRFCVHPDRSRIDRGSAFGTERLLAFVAAVAGLDVDLQRPGEKLEGARLGLHDRAKGRSRQRLTIRTMANNHLRGVDFSLIPDTATMTTAIDLHCLLLTYEPSAPPDFSASERVKNK